MKILYVTTISNTLNAFLIPHIKMLVDQGHQVDVACNIEAELKPKLLDVVTNVFEIPFSRSPIKTQNIQAYKQLKSLVVKEKYDIVHTHTPVASMIVRLACRNQKNTKVFYTAHGFHFFKGAPLKNWLLFYPIEKWLSRYTDTLITINKEDFQLAKKKFKADRFFYMPSVGLDLNRFHRVHEKGMKRKELGISEKSIVLLSVGELNKNKNHSTIIKSIAKLKDRNIHYIICGEGNYRKELERLSKECKIENRIHLLGFREDVLDICYDSDIFIFPSLREGLGMAALEAMACGLPLITSNVHGIVDYSIDGVTGYSCNPHDIERYADRIEYLINNKNIREEMSANNTDAVKKYSMESAFSILMDIYKQNSGS